MDLQGLSSICACLGEIEEDENGDRIGYVKSESCLDNLNDLRRFLRRDDPQSRDVFKEVCKWNIVSKNLVPIIEHCQDDTELVMGAVKVLVFLTMPIEPGSNDIPDQIDYLWGLKASLTRSVTLAVIVSLLESPLENLECEAFTEDDWKLVQLVLTLFRNILAIQDISTQQKASGSATQYLSLRDRFLELLFHENVADVIMVLTQYVGGSCGYLREDNLLLLEIFHYMFLGQEPELIAKASKKGPKVEEGVTESLDSLKSIMEEEKDKRRLTRNRNVDRHSQFSGSFTRLAMDGSKTLCKGNPGTSSHDTMLKPHKVQRGPQKRIAWDSGRLSSSNETILGLLHDFVNQLLSGGYNALMQSIREDIEKEHHAIQRNDIVIFFQLSQFATAFQHHTFLISKSKMEAGSSEAFVNNTTDSTIFRGDICGPIAATMNEAMFLLVISRWRSAFEGLKETNDYKFLSVAGSLMKNMIRMLDLVLKLLPEDSKEPQTARILLYKIFYDQTDQGMTQFLMSLIRSFDTHKQPRSDLADLVEMIHVVVRLMENLQARGTLRVSRKARRARKKKPSIDVKGTENTKLSEGQVNVNADDGNSTCETSANMPPKDPSETSNSDGKENSILVSNQVEELEIPPLDTGNTVDDSVPKENKEFGHNPDDIACELSDSEDEQLAATDEVDFNVSSLISTFANNTIIQNLCWLLKYYKSNSTGTNHYILTMLRRICDDLELAPMLYQLSLLTTFYNILAEQKSSPRKEYANIVSFLTNLVRKMLRKMKKQPLLFVEILFWKTRKECHYINSEFMLHELGNLRKETRHWGNVSSANEGEMGASQGKGGTGKRTIADALGEDEFDVILHEPNHLREKGPNEANLQKVTQRNEVNFGEGSRNMNSKSTSETDGVKTLQSDDAHNEGNSLEYKPQRTSKRRKRLVFDPELETKLKNLYEKYKDARDCNRLIAEALDPTGGVSPAQVFTKLKQLGLKIASKNRMLHTDGISSETNEGQPIRSDDTHHNLKELDESTLLKRSLHSRKRVRAFSKEQEGRVKELYEQFKHHKRCSHMIADALDADNTFTATQVSRKIKQLGLKKEKMHLLDEDSEDLNADGEEESDKETLSSLKKRRNNNKKSKMVNEEVTARGSPEQNIESISLHDDSDDEFLSTILEKTSKNQPKHRDRKLKKTSSIETTILDDPQHERDDSSTSSEPGSALKDVEHELADFDSNDEANQIDSFNGTKQTDALMNDVSNIAPKLHVELEDSGDDDVESIATKATVSRRKVKMVIDMDDDEDE